MLSEVEVWRWFLLRWKLYQIICGIVGGILKVWPVERYISEDSSSRR